MTLQYGYARLTCKSNTLVDWMLLFGTSQSKYMHTTLGEHPRIVRHLGCSQFRHRRDLPVGADTMQLMILRMLAFHTSPSTYGSANFMGRKLGVFYNTLDACLPDQSIQAC
jgi:hypothetical protein